MLKKIICLFIIVAGSVTAQFNNYPKPDEGYLTGGIGMVWIDGQPHYRLSFRPELSMANFGVGLDLNLDFDSEGNLRDENFNETSDYLSLIRYVRYGYKNDPVFIKLGALDYYTIGHGTIMYLYNNSPSFDSRKIGLALDLDFGTAGFESVYSSFAESGVFGLRGFVRPLQFTEARSIPVIGGVEIGATYATDFHENAGRVYSPAPADFGSINIIGIDIGFPLLSTPFTGITLYFDYNKIIDFGSGIASGVVTNFNGLGLVNLSAKLERRFNNDKYIPSYFNSLYEIERYQQISDLIFTSKATELNNAVNQSDGFYGELLVDVVGIFQVLGSYQRLDDFPTSGILHLGTEIAPEEAPVVLRANYDKINIKDESDVFKLDDRSFLMFELGYKPVEYLLVSLVYNWTFTPFRNSDDEIIGYEPQKRIEPRISFIYPFQI
ncbi:MAG: hypothetical protein Kow0098_18640 [Ignavibacteriaceae bacterium]